MVVRNFGTPPLNEEVDVNRVRNKAILERTGKSVALLSCREGMNGKGFELRSLVKAGIVNSGGHWIISKLSGRFYFCRGGRHISRCESGGERLVLCKLEGMLYRGS
ncbi:hypothetical protein AVEN_53445-1 [Araneus ventricosus]|uniref:Uncharacterized protein n=1 Tax=Araneus ventricosus TaxID=182803 RepID=A0A4Y2ABY5_ARAVE|nr:hypothetical protein AVEN_53445-1 [Araneus ventricosus]